MIDKGKYASHGSYIKRLGYNFLAKRDKPKLAIIHPLPTTKPRETQINEQSKDMIVNSKTFSAKFRFQENIDRVPVAQQLAQPFLYIEKVIRKNRVDKKPVGKIKKQSTKHVKKGPKQMPAVPSGFNSLYDYQQQRRRIANKVFQKLLECDIRNIKDMFFLWHGKSKTNNSDIDIKESEFVQFIKEIVPGKISQKQIRRFFQLYKNKTPLGKQKDDQFRIISIKALAYNYEKYRKAQIEVANIMSHKAAKQRYIFLKDQLTEFDKNYHSLKQAMNSIKNYEESLKRHFQSLYDSYRNPYEEEISKLKKELQKPIIKYDKFKKQQLTSKIEAYTAKNSQMHRKLTQDYERFIQNYDQAIITNHDLFFTKRTSDKLLRPLLQQYPYLTRQLIQKRVEEEQTKKQQFLQCLSDLVVQLDKDKQYLGEDSFTLDQIVQMILMRGKKVKDTNPPKFDDEFTLYSVKKLIKQIKKQFLVKNQLIVSSFQEFPSDQQIDMQILHTCFEMECTKVLFKNQIWQELLAMIPQEETTSKLHQHTINSNLCLQFVKRYFSKLDQRTDIQLNKSKQISLLAEDVTIDGFSEVANIIDGVINSLGDYVEDEDQQKDTVEPLDKRRVKFADVVDSAYEKTNFPHKFKPEEPMQQNEEELQRQKEAIIVKSLIKSIFQMQPQIKYNQFQQPLRQIPINKDLKASNNFQGINTLANSFYVPEGLNTNSFDIRYYQKVKQKQERNRSHQPQVVRMGSSLLLSDLPHVQDIKSSDPLRISRFLMSNIDNGVKEEQRIIRQKMLQSSIKQGVSNNYYKDRIKLQNKPTIYDSEGKTKYSVLLPVGYYQSFVATENIPDKDKWYLRAHHVETLTENPLSKKDNIIHTEYQSKLQKLPLKKRPDEYIIEQNVKRKGDLIGQLEERINALKNNLEHATRGSRVQGTKVPSTIVDNYYSKLTENKEDKELQLASYQGVLYDLRRKQRQLLVDFREGQSRVVGQASEKWWQRKDKQFNNQLRKDRLLVADSLRPQQKHREYVDKLKNSQIY